MLVFGTPAPSPRLRERIVAVHGRSAQLGNASRWDLPPETVEELLDLDDPEINEKLYVYGAIAWKERARILAGRGRRGGGAATCRSPTSSWTKSPGSTSVTTGTG
ncbi:hypothetical protein [Streptomyces sp. NPDC051211]|uniref:hypothetical protein n=1 Tax=Streptomyces sp. NPDC051211 TaxID=3154643 RepID=UPI00344FBF8A